MSAEIQVVVFDLADVLFEFRGPESLAELSGGRVGPAEFDRPWSSPLADAFYRGTCTPNDFAVGAVTQLDLPISPGAFLRAFATWFSGPFPGALELVEDVRAGAAAVCLSNTNPLDVSRFRAELDIDRRFDRGFFSNEIGLRKPDRACYQYVPEELRFADRPNQTVLLDDSPGNVAAARAIGMRVPSRWHCRGSIVPQFPRPRSGFGAPGA